MFLGEVVVFGGGGFEWEVLVMALFDVDHFNGVFLEDAFEHVRFGGSGK